MECSPSNGKKVLAALEEFGAPISGINAKDFATAGTAYTAGLAPLRFDILTRVSGGDFKVAYKEKVKTSIKGVPLYYVSLATLILLKKSAGRPQDKVDYKKLQRVLKETT